MRLFLNSLITSSIKGWGILCLGIIMGLPLQAQRLSFGTLPAINVNQPLAPSWSLNLKWESRQLFWEQGIDGQTEASIRYVLSDFSMLAGWRRGPQSKWVGGYLLRLGGLQTAHRLIQQYVFVQPFRRFRLAHRFGADQTFRAGEMSVWRLRYRIALELPLNGEVADPQEFYLKLNHEYINAWQGRFYNLELRLVPWLGYTLASGQKFEIGMDYRLDGFLAKNARQRLWLGMNWYVKR